MTNARRPKLSVVTTSLSLTVALAFAACGGKIEAVDLTSSQDPSTDSSRDSGRPTPTFFDAGASFDTDASAPAYPPVVNGPSDTNPSCASRSDFNCDCQGEDCPPGADNALRDLAEACSHGHPACGWIYVDFDADGCALDLRMDDPDPGFVACISAKLDAVRWVCAEASELKTGQAKVYLDCTVPNP